MKFYALFIALCFLPLTADESAEKNSQSADVAFQASVLEAQAKLQNSIADAEKIYLNEYEAARQVYSKHLLALQEQRTKSGDLDGALEAREKRRAIEAEVASATEVRKKLDDVIDFEKKLQSKTWLRSDGVGRGWTHDFVFRPDGWIYDQNGKNTEIRWVTLNPGSVVTYAMAKNSRNVVDIMDFDFQDGRVVVRCIGTGDVVKTTWVARAKK